MNQLELICQTYSLCYEKIFLYKINYKKLYNLIRIKLKKKLILKIRIKYSCMSVDTLTTRIQ